MKASHTRMVATSIASAVLAGCSQTLPTPVYQPANTTEINGAVEVLPLVYQPIHPVAPNQLHTDTPAAWLLEEPIANYVTTAVRREFRQTGLSIVAGSPCSMTGTIREITVDPQEDRTGSEIHYQVKAGAAVVFDKPITGAGTMPWVWDPNDIMTAAEKTVATNIFNLLDDPEFQLAVAEHCQR